MSEETRQARSILFKLGITDGLKHINQLIYFAEELDSQAVLLYWTRVKEQFIYATNNNTPNKEK